jgi:DNA-binding IclR family transcriptional regulator
MAKSPISKTLIEFIQDYIQSVEQLEILRLFAENSARKWQANEVFRHTQSMEVSVKTSLKHFVNHGLLAEDAEEFYQFSPNTPELARRVSDFLKTYRERPVAVIEAIYRQPVVESVQQVAETCRGKKDK